MSTDIGFRAWLRGEAFVESIPSNFPVKSVGYIATIVVTSRARNSRLVDKINVRLPLGGFLARFSERGTDVTIDVRRFRGKSQVSSVDGSLW